MLCSRISWESPDDADGAAGRSVAGDEGSSDLSTPCRRRHAPTLIGVDPKTVRRERPPDNPEIREEMHKIAEKRRRFGYRRVGIMLERKGMIMNEKKLYPSPRSSSKSCITVSRSRLARAALAARSRSSSASHAPSFGRG
jgi:hypothetical protein